MVALVFCGRIATHAGGVPWPLPAPLYPHYFMMEGMSQLRLAQTQAQLG